MRLRPSCSRGVGCRGACCSEHIVGTLAATVPGCQSCVRFLRGLEAVGLEPGKVSAGACQSRCDSGHLDSNLQPSSWRRWKLNGSSCGGVVGSGRRATAGLASALGGEGGGGRGRAGGRRALFRQRTRSIPVPPLAATKGRLILHYRAAHIVEGCLTWQLIALS